MMRFIRNQTEPNRYFCIYKITPAEYESEMQKIF